MGDYSYSELENLWISNGGNPASAPIAAAIALAESSGDSTVVNSIGATGLWQILQSAHPQWSIQQLQDPNINAQAAISISNNGSNWNPWQTYTEGTYLNFLQGGSANPNTTSANSATFTKAGGGCNFGTISIAGSTICPDGIIGIASIGVGLVLLTSGVLICVAFALKQTGIGKAAKQAMVAVGGPYTKVAGLVA